MVGKHQTKLWRISEVSVVDSDIIELPEGAIILDHKITTVLGKSLGDEYESEPAHLVISLTYMEEV